MGMAVAQPGQNHFSTRIDDTGAFSNQRNNGRIGPDSDDVFSPNCNRLSLGKMIIDREDIGVGDRQIRCYFPAHAVGKDNRQP